MMKNVKLVFLEYLEDHAGTVLVNVSGTKDILITNCKLINYQSYHNILLKIFNLGQL